MQLIIHFENINLNKPFVREAQNHNKMTTIVRAKVNPIEDKDNLINAVSELKKSMKNYKKERKTDWKLFKTKFNEDMDNIKKSLKIMTSVKKK